MQLIREAGMNNEIEPSLLISLVILIAVIAVVVWWYGVRKQTSADKQKASFTSPGYKDKLTLIDGIGETLEKKLNALGITSFRQIAELKPQDIERVNDELRFKGRIEREGWVAQARKLVEGASRRTVAVSPAGTTTGTKKKTAAGPARKVSKKKTPGKKANGKKVAKKTTKKKTRKAKKKTKKTGR